MHLLYSEPLSNPEYGHRVPILLSANIITGLSQAKMERKVGVSLDFVFPGGLNWFKIDLSHHWDNFWISAFREKRST